MQSSRTVSLRLSKNEKNRPKIEVHPLEWTLEKPLGIPMNSEVHPLEWTLEKPLGIPMNSKGCIFYGD